MFGNKKENIEKCCICRRLIRVEEESIKVKEKIIFENNGIWFNFKTSFICNSCITEIKRKVNAEV